LVGIGKPKGLGSHLQAPAFSKQKAGRPWKQRNVEQATEPSCVHFVHWPSVPCTREGMTFTYKFKTK